MKRLILTMTALTLLAPFAAYGQNEFSEEFPENEVTVVDTLNTLDKYTKIVLYSNHTWEYFDCERPKIDTSGMYYGWDTGTIHAFKDIKLSDLPDEVDLLLADSDNPYCPPIVNRVTSRYKMRRSRAHRGVDIKLNVGDTIRAAFNGIVRYTGPTRETGGYGNLVVIRHPNGLETYYGHLSKVSVEVDEPVSAGEMIGLGGSTGRSTGPHLHFETRYMGNPFDPERIFDYETGALRDTMFTLKKHYFNIYSHYGQSDAESKAASGRVYHKVRKGDTLGRIAIKYGTTVNRICKLNNISAKKTLRIGQSIQVR